MAMNSRKHFTDEEESLGHLKERVLGEFNTSGIILKVKVPEVNSLMSLWSWITE